MGNKLHQTSNIKENGRRGRGDVHGGRGSKVDEGERVLLLLLLLVVTVVVVVAWMMKNNEEKNERKYA